MRLQIRPGKFREPDLLLLLSAADPRRQNRFWLGADIALEVVSEEKPERDLVDKRGDYAEGRVPEYWIVNPQTETITVLRLRGDAYEEAGTYRRGESAASTLLAGFSVAVAAVFDAKWVTGPEATQSSRATDDVVLRVEFGSIIRVDRRRPTSK